MTEILELKKQLTSFWRDLQDGTKTSEVRMNAYSGVISTTNKLRELDKNFALDEKALEKFIEFKPDNVEQLDKKVKWVKMATGTKLEDDYNQYVGIALSIVTKRHPELDTDNDKFGTIVNATTANLIQADLINLFSQLDASRT